MNLTTRSGIIQYLSFFYNSYKLVQFGTSLPCLGIKSLSWHCHMYIAFKMLGFKPMHLYVYASYYPSDRILDYIMMMMMIYISTLISPAFPFWPPGTIIPLLANSSHPQPLYKIWLTSCLWRTWEFSVPQQPPAALWSGGCLFFHPSYLMAPKAVRVFS